MLQLLIFFRDICLLRAKPQDLPASWPLFGLTIVGALLSGLLVLSDVLGGAVQALLTGVLDILLVIGLLRVLLPLFGKELRFLQTATAIFGSGTLFNLVSYPLHLMAANDPKVSDIALLGSILYLFLYLFFLVWSLVVLGHVLRHALEIRLRAGILFAFGYFMLINLMVQILFPVV